MNSPIIDGRAASLSSQDVVISQSEELRWRDVLLVTTVDSQIIGFIDVLLQIVEAVVVVLECSDAAEVLHVAVWNELLWIYVLQKRENKCNS